MMPENMRPTHRRSEETGEIEDHWSDSVTMPPDTHFDDELAPLPAPDTERGEAEMLRRVLALLKDGRRATMPARLAAVEYTFRLNGNTLREAAREAGCEVKTVCDAVRKFRRIYLSKPEQSTTSRPL